MNIRKELNLMNETQLFNFKNEELRTVRTDEDEIWFLGNDVARILKYSKYRNAIYYRVDSDDKLRLQIRDAGQNRKVTFINEAGVYSLVFGSNLREAKEFKHWISHEVLPQLRKNGSYSIQGRVAKDSYMINDPIERAEAWIREQQRAKDDRIARQKAERENRLLAPNAKFGKQVTDSDGTVSVGQFATYLTQNGVKIGRNRLFKMLRTKKFLGKRGSNYNNPTQKSLDLGLMISLESVVDKGDGRTFLSHTTRITGKGEKYFLERLTEENK